MEKWNIGNIIQEKISKMTIKELKIKHGITDTDISKAFGYKNQSSYSNSSAKARIEQGLINMDRIYDETRKSQNKNQK